MIPVSFFDRSAMGVSLAVHIVIVVIGMSLPLFIAIYEYLGIKKKDEDYRMLARHFTKVFIVFFAVGTASGFVVAANSFGWPKYTQLVGNVAILAHT
ncbi:MAG: cytochrome ubiquinol oxidase subunit I [Nitrosotalea sp.]